MYKGSIRLMLSTHKITPYMSAYNAVIMGGSFMLLVQTDILQTRMTFKHHECRGARR